MESIGSFEANTHPREPPEQAENDERIHLYKRDEPVSRLVAGSINRSKPDVPRVIGEVKGFSLGNNRRNCRPQAHQRSLTIVWDVDTNSGLPTPHRLVPRREQPEAPSPLLRSAAAPAVSPEAAGFAAISGIDQTGGANLSTSERYRQDGSILKRTIEKLTSACIPLAIILPPK
jgi:hypothetical protein